MRGQKRRSAPCSPVPEPPTQGSEVGGTRAEPPPHGWLRSPCRRLLPRAVGTLRGLGAGGEYPPVLPHTPKSHLPPPRLCPPGALTPSPGPVLRRPPQGAGCGRQREAGQEGPGELRGQKTLKEGHEALKGVHKALKGVRKALRGGRAQGQGRGCAPPTRCAPRGAAGAEGAAGPRGAEPGGSRLFPLLQAIK